MCREEAHQLWTHASELEALGVGLVAIVKEVLPKQIDDEFRPKFWGGPIFHDPALGFFSHLGGGKPKKLGFMALVRKPARMAISRSGDYLKKIGGKQNMTGEGFVMGGLYVVKPGKGDEGIVYRFQEKEFGMTAPWEEVLAAAKTAVGAS